MEANAWRRTIPRRRSTGSGLDQSNPVEEDTPGALGAEAAAMEVRAYGGGRGGSNCPHPVGPFI